jgi:hypothetical protein
MVKYRVHKKLNSYYLFHMNIILHVTLFIPREFNVILNLQCNNVLYLLKNALNIQKRYFYTLLANCITKKKKFRNLNSCVPKNWPDQCLRKSIILVGARSLQCNQSPTGQVETDQGRELFTGFTNQQLETLIKGHDT